MPLPPARETPTSGLPPSPLSFQRTRRLLPVLRFDLLQGRDGWRWRNNQGRCGALHIPRGSEPEGSLGPSSVELRGESPGWGRAQVSSLLWGRINEATSLSGCEREGRRLPDGGLAVGGEAPGKRPGKGERWAIINAGALRPVTVPPPPHTHRRHPITLEEEEEGASASATAAGWATSATPGRRWRRWQRRPPSPAGPALPPAATSREPCPFLRRGGRGRRSRPAVAP